MNFSFLKFRISWRSLLHFFSFIYLFLFLFIYFILFFRQNDIAFGSSKFWKDHSLIGFVGKAWFQSKGWMEKKNHCFFFDEYSIFSSLISYPIWKLKFLV